MSAKITVPKDSKIDVIINAWLVNLKAASSNSDIEYSYKKINSLYFLASIHIPQCDNTKTVIPMCFINNGGELYKANKTMEDGTPIKGEKCGTIKENHFSPIED